MDLADKLIAQTQADERKKNNGFAPHYGIDETGIPIPKPVNSDYIILRIIGNVNMYRIGDEFYVDKRRYRQGPQSLIALCGRPNIVLFEDIDEDDKDAQYIAKENMWRQVKNTINSEHGLIWEKMREMVPQYNKRYLRINRMLVWDRETSEILIIPDDYL